MASLVAPGLLFAVPQLLDPNFLRSVVLLVEHTDAGAFGLVLNHETTIRLAAVCEEQQIAYEGGAGKRVRRGGPVRPGQGFVLYAPGAPDLAGHQVVEGLHFSLSRETLALLCSRPEARFECYLGYAGWGPGQLAKEIEEGAWVTGPVDAALVLEAAPAVMWEKGLRANGIDPALLVPGSSTEA